MDRSQLRFSKTVLSEFIFLTKEYNFSCKLCEDTFVRYESDKVFVDIFHGRVSYEVGLQLGLLKYGRDTGYGLGSIISFTDPEKGNKFRYCMTSTPEGVRKGVRKTAQLLKKYGDKALLGDSIVFQWLSEDVEKYWAEREAKQIRPKAEKAFRDKDFKNAAKLYKSIEHSLTLAEEKKLKYAIKNS